MNWGDSKELVAAICKRDVEKVGRYLDQHPKSINKHVKYKNEAWRGKCTPVFYAVSRNDIHTVKLLILRGADVNIPAYIRTSEYQEKITCFVHACHNSYVDLLKVLVEAGANVESPAEGGQELEAEGGYMNFAEGHEQTTCLQWAVCRFKRSLVQELLNLGADPNLRSATGQTCLHCVCELFCPVMIKEVIQAGGVSSHPDMSNITPLTNIVSFPPVLVDDKAHTAQAFELVALMLSAGYDLKYEAWLISGRYALNAGRVEDAFAEDDESIMYAPHSEVVRNIVRKKFGKDFLLWLFKWPCTPKTLKFLCRVSIRRTIGSRCLRAKLSQLELPRVLLEYLDLAL